MKNFRIEYKFRTNPKEPRRTETETRGFDKRSEVIAFIKEIVSNPGYKITNIKRKEQVISANETLKLLYDARLIHKPSSPTQAPLSPTQEAAQLSSHESQNPTVLGSSAEQTSNSSGSPSP